MGYEIPKNLQEFEKITFEFVHNYESGNAETEKVGIVVENIGKIEGLFLGIYPELCNLERGWILENGEYIPSYSSAYMGDALVLLQEWLEKGILDSEFYSKKVSESVKDFIDGNSIAIAIPLNALIEQWDAAGGEGKIEEQVVVMRPWELETGERYRFSTTEHWSELYINGKSEPEKIDKILQLLDYTLSDEMKKDMQNFQAMENESIKVLAGMIKYGAPFQFENYELYPTIYSEELVEMVNEDNKMA